MPVLRDPGLRPGGVMAVVLMFTSASCVRQVITVSPREIHRHVRELRRQGHARVDVRPSGSRELTTGSVLDVGFATGTRKLTVDQLIAHCPEVPPFLEDTSPRDGSCMLLETTSPAIPLGTRLRPDREAWKGIGGATVVALVLGVGLGYLISCSEPDDGC